jgi:uncharacterized membrane protein SirB2
VLIAAYVVLGVAAFRSESAGRAVLIYLAALAVFLTIASLSLYKPL